MKHCLPGLSVFNCVVVLVAGCGGDETQVAPVADSQRIESSDHFTEPMDAEAHGDSMTEPQSDAVAEKTDESSPASGAPQTEDNSATRGAADITGDWDGGDWGDVTIEGGPTEFTGTYSATYNGELGLMSFEVDGDQLRGTWRETDDRHGGTIELELSEDGRKLNVGYTRKGSSSVSRSTWIRQVEPASVASRPESAPERSQLPSPLEQLSDLPWVDLEASRDFDSSYSPAVSFAPDGKLLLTPGRAWNLDTGESWSLKGVRAPVQVLADGATFISHSSEGATLWSLETWQPIRTVPGTIGALSPTGLAVVSDPTVDQSYGFRVWNLDTGEDLFTFVRNEDSYNLAFSDDAKTLLLWNDQKVRLFDVAEGKERPGIDSFPANLDQVVLSPDGTRLLCMEEAPSFPSIWDIADPEQRPRIIARAKERYHGSGVFSPDGQVFVDGVQVSGRSVLAIVNVSTMSEVTRLTGMLPPRFTPAGLVIAPAPGAQVMVADPKGQALANISVGQDETGFKPNFYDASVSPDGSVLALPLNGNTLRLVKLPTASETNGGRPQLLIELPAPSGLREFHELFDEQSQTATLTFSGDGKYLVGHGSEMNFAAWELPGGRQVASGVEQGWCILPGGETLFTQSWAQNFRTRLEVQRNLQTGREQVRELGGGYEHPFQYKLLASSPDGKGIAAVVTTSADGNEQEIRYFPEGDPDQFVAVGEGDVSRFAFSADGKLLSTWYSGKVRLFDLTERTERPTNAELAQDYLAFADGGSAIATAAIGNNRAALFDVDSGTQIHEFDLRQGHAATPSAVAFSPVSSVWATGDRDGTVLVRDWKSGRLLSRFTAHEGRILALAFSWNGGMLATATGGNADPVVRIWELPGPAE